MKKVIFVGFLLVIAGCRPRAFSLERETAEMIQRSKSEAGTFVVHKPKAGCPEEFTLTKGYFEEKDGTHQDACVKAGQGNATHIDYLLGGESYSLTLTLPAAEKPRSPKTVL